MDKQIYNSSVRFCKKVDSDAKFLKGYNQGLCDMAEVKDAEIQKLNSELCKTRELLQKYQERDQLRSYFLFYSDTKEAWVHTPDGDTQLE